jgi:FkbM family methyltransferase
MSLTLDTYVAAPSPVEGELRRLFVLDDVRVVFDIGSCEGEDSIRYARLFPNATVYAAEPLPRNLPRLHENLRRHNASSVEVLPFAFSDASGSAQFYVSAGQPDDRPHGDQWDYGNKSSSLFPPDKHLEIHPWVRFDQVIQVQTDTLANFCASRQIDTIDFIHMDVQGAELKVLAGAGDLISRIKAVWTEVERIPLYAGQPLKSDVERFMEDHAFLKLKDTVGAVSGDQLFVNRALVRVPVRIRAARSAPVVFGLRVGRRVGQMIRVIARRSARLIHPD